MRSQDKRNLIPLNFLHGHICCNTAQSLVLTGITPHSGSTKVQHGLSMMSAMVAMSSSSNLGRSQAKDLVLFTLYIYISIYPHLCLYDNVYTSMYIYRLALYPYLCLTKYVQAALREAMCRSDGPSKASGTALSRPQSLRLQTSTHRFYPCLLSLPG